MPHWNPRLSNEIQRKQTVASFDFNPSKLSEVTTSFFVVAPFFLFSGPVYQEMVDNLLNPLERVNLMRFDVSFAQKGSSLDTMIGRASHIFFLDQALYINMLISVYKKYFSGDPPEIILDDDDDESKSEKEKPKSKSRSKSKSKESNNSSDD